ncbi:hypothetical protein TSUD_97700 [Trifolium subterraneum]|uniref:Zinc knuckle CX2CX4HX4C domain-containing protein n=1 Tax=Trifolium subterraneum TaxID=3900 RepID=A0A2Z6PVJ2_TRISU|nr:hypothetical protein TSUD_97700 [Trifolium subterraneum]
MIYVQSDPLTLGTIDRVSFEPLLGPLTSTLTRCSTPLLKHGYVFMFLLVNIAAPKYCSKLQGLDLGIPLTLDEATMKINFGHFARVLIEVDLNFDLRERILVEKNDFDFYVDIEYEKLPLFCNSCPIVGHSVQNCKYQAPKVTTKEIKPETLRRSTLSGLKPTPLDQPKSKEATKFLVDVLNNEEEIPICVVEAVPVYIQDTSSWSDMTSAFVGDANLDNDVFCQELHEEVVAESHPLVTHDRSLVVQESDLSNFNANVIHDMQVLGILSASTAAQQAMDFLSDSWANMAQTEEIVDSVGNTNQQFLLVVPKKMKNKFK